jgi:hypothetical protein
MTEPLTKVDSAVEGLSSSPPKKEEGGLRRKSSAVPGVYNINDLGELSTSSRRLGSPTSPSHR